jgi:translation initiation factor 6
MNDNGIVIPPTLKRLQNQLEKFFGLPCNITTIAGLNPLGSLGIATNKGVLVHPQITDKEAKMIERTLEVPLDVGTVNFGSPYPGSGIIANSHGFVAGTSTSGIELGRIAETFGFD